MTIPGIALNVSAPSSSSSSATQPDAAPLETGAIPTLNGVENTPLDMAGLMLQLRKAAVEQALGRSKAGEVAGLTAMLDKAKPHELEAVVAAVEKALADRGLELTVLKDFMLGIANTTLDKMRWGTLARQFPGATGAVALAQLARAMYQGTWADVAKALTTVGMTVLTLPPEMTSLRGIPLIDAMVASLPEVLRSQLDAVHQWVQQGDDALTPALDLRQLGPVIAVVALLWYVQQRLPSPSGQLSGLGRFIADLPQNWQRLVSLDRIGAGLFAPVNTGRGLIAQDEVLPSVREKPLPQEKAQRIAYNRWNDRQHLPGANATAPVIDALSTPVRAVVEAPAVPFEAAVTPGAAARGGAIAPPPAAPDDAATSAGGGSVASWWTWLTTATGVLRGFQQVAQSDSAPYVEEMVLMDSSAGPGVVSNVADQETEVALPLLEVPAAATAAARRFPNLRRTALATAVVGGLGAVGTGLWKLAAHLSATTRPPTPTDLATGVIEKVVQDPNGTWHAGIDELLGLQGLDVDAETPAVQHLRVRRALFSEHTTTPAPTPTVMPSAATQLGLDSAQLEAVRKDLPLQSQLQSMRLWAQAIAQEMGHLPDREWIARLPEGEQVLVALQWHTLRELKPQMAVLKGSAATLLGQALAAAGWTGEWSDIEAKLPSLPVAGITAEDSLPLLQYCLVRRDPSTPNALPMPTFTRGGVPLDAPTQQRLQAFVNSGGCSGLAAAVKQRSEALRPLLNRALRARMIIDGIKAKSHHHDNGELQRHGAGLLVKFLQDQPDVERSVLSYVDRLPNGRTVSIALPNYLVLRATGGDPRVVLYRADLSDVKFFSDDTSLRNFLDETRLRDGVAANKGAPDATLAADIVNAADPAQRIDVAALVGQWTERHHLHLQRKNDPNGWNPNTSFQLDFTPVGPMNNAQKWAAALVSHGEVLARQAQARNVLRWNPLGIAKVKADEAYQQQRASVVQTLYVHAQPEVLRGLAGVLGKHGIDAKASGFDPDRVKLTWNGVEMSLTAWASHGWQKDGLRRPALSNTLPDIQPDAGLLPNLRYEVPEWPSADQLDAIKIKAYHRDATGNEVENAALSGALKDHDLRREICGWLEAYADDNTLAKAYVNYLRGIPNSPAGIQLGEALGNRIRTGLAWMVEVAGQDGTLNPDNHRGLVHALERLDPVNGRTSSLHVVTLDGVPIEGLWALHDGDEFRIFLPGENGSDNQLLDETAFKTWLKGSTSYTRFPEHVLFRYHKKLAQAFANKDTRAGIPVGFLSTDGPDAAAHTLIAGRISDVEEISLTPLEQMAEALRIAGAVSAALVCSLATGGLGAGFCAAASLALVADGIVQAIDQFDRGDSDDAIASIGGSLHDAVDVLQISAMASLLFRIGKAALHSLQDAAAALRQFKAQARAFDTGGKVNAAFAVSRQDLPYLPMFERRVPGGGTVYQQDGREFIRVGEGNHVEVAADADGILRLQNLEDANTPGAPVHYQDGWKRMDSRPEARRGTTPLPDTPMPAWVSAIPQAEVLPPAKLDKLEAIFGVRRLGNRPNADIRGVVSDWSMEQRIQKVIADPKSLGQAGDEPIMMRAVADSVLGGGKSVQTFFYELGEWTAGARFGANRAVGTYVQVDNARTLPGLEAIVEAIGMGTVAQKLDLPAGASEQQVLVAVKRELVGVIGRAPAQSLLTWQRWVAMQNHLPTAADNLHKHYPGVSKEEAQELVDADRMLAKQSENWVFSSRTDAVVANKVADRLLRQQRQAVVNGSIRTLAEVNVLQTHLQAVIPGRSWRSMTDLSSGGIALEFSADDGTTAGRIVFLDNGAVHGADTAQPAFDSWQQGVFEQLSDNEKQVFGDAEGLNKALLERMKQTPDTSVCALPPPGGRRPRRGLADCDPQQGVSLLDNERKTLVELNDELIQLHEQRDASFVELSLLEREYKALFATIAADKKEGRVNPDNAQRLRELQKLNFASLQGFRNRNFANYRLEDLSYQGEALDLGASFATTGFAISGSPLNWAGVDNGLSNFVRRVLLPNAVAENKVVQNGMFPEHYAMGADLTPVAGKMSAPGQASKEIVFTEDDLRVKIPGQKGKVALSELTDAAVEGLDKKDVSPLMQQVMADAKLLPSNAKALVPGQSYRLYQIRTCSEDKIMNGLFDGLAASKPAIAGVLRAAADAPLLELSGKLYLLSDMHPCATSCDRRLNELAKFLPDVAIRVFYRFEDGTDRDEWMVKQTILRIIELHEDAWQAQGHSRAKMEALATELLNDPQTKQRLETDIARRPLALPPPKLWAPTDTMAF